MRPNVYPFARRFPCMLRASLVVCLLALLLAPTSAQEVPANPWADQDRPFRVGVGINTPPAAYLVGDDYGGWGPDMMAIGSLKLGITVEYVPFESNEEGVAMLRNGSVDAVGIMGQRPDLVEFANLGTPWSWTPIVLLTNDAHDWTSLDDATGTISTIPGSPMEAIVSERFARMTYIETANPTEGAQALADGSIDAYIGPLALIGHQIQVHQLEGLRPVGDALSIVETGFWAADPLAIETRDAIRGAITDDEARVMHVKWTGFDLGNPERPTEAPAWLLPAGLATLGVLVALGIVIAFQRLRVREARAEIEAREANAAAAKARTELETSQRMEAFTRGMLNRTAHEFATPLMPALTAAASLKANLSDPEALRKLELVKRNLDRLLAVHREMVEATKQDIARTVYGDDESE